MKASEALRKAMDDAGMRGVYQEFADKVIARLFDNGYVLAQYQFTVKLEADDNALPSPASSVSGENAPGDGGMKE